jgi:hypothetical protein
MKFNKTTVKIKNNLRSSVIFENPPPDYWSQIKGCEKYRSLADIDESVLNLAAEVIEDTNSEYKVMFVNGQSGWIWKDNCTQLKKLS